VLRVTLEVGTLSCVMPDALRFGYDVAVQNTILQGSELEIIHDADRGHSRCRDCGVDIEMHDMQPTALSAARSIGKMTAVVCYSVRVDRGGSSSFDNKLPSTTWADMRNMTGSSLLRYNCAVIGTALVTLWRTSFSGESAVTEAERQGSLFERSPSQ
jgi:Zn finger protein HypA/HybF involved in hydrogenase expression